MKKYELIRLMLDEISLVDDPANQYALSVLTKSLKGSGMDVSQVETFLSLVRKGEDVETAFHRALKTAKESEMGIDELNALVKRLEGDVSVLRKEAEGYQKAAEEAGLEVTKKGEGDDLQITFTPTEEFLKRNTPKDDEYVELNGERIHKSQVPAPVLKALRDNNEELAKLRKQREDDDLRKRAEDTLPNLAGDALAKARVLKAIDDIEDEDQRKAMLEGLKAADAAVSKMFAESGHTGPAEDSAEAHLNKMVEKHASENGVSYEVAYADVTKGGEGLTLLKKMREEKQAA